MSDGEQDSVRVLVRVRNPSLGRMACDPNAPAGELETWSNCFFWALWRWLRYGGSFVIEDSPRIPVWRAYWCPQGDRGPKWHFDPVKPKRGIRGIWAAFWHKGKPRNMRERHDTRTTRSTQG